MGKKGKKAQAGKPKKPTPKDVGKRMDVLAKKLEEELEGADLFAPLPPTEDCAVCLVPLSHVQSESIYQTCCGNTICKACVMEHQESIKKQNEEKNTGKKVAFTCPFCRELLIGGLTTEAVKKEYARLQARFLQNDHNAFTLLGNIYRRGTRETPKDDMKALDCFIRAVELGSPEACGCIASHCIDGNGVNVNRERASLFGRVGALRGHITARHAIGISEYESGNHEIAIRHWKIAAEAGHQPSLNNLRCIYNADGKMPGKEFVSNEEMDAVYRSGHEAQLEVKSEEREKHSGMKK